MEKIGPKEAAAQIREEFLNEHIDPRFHHQVRFSGQILDELGAERSIENTAKVMRLLTAHGIEGHSYAEYPRWVKNERGERAVVNDEDHEAAFMARPASHDEDGKPNPEHGHVDPQSGLFHAGMKPIVYGEEWKEEIHRAEEVAEQHELSPELDAELDRELADRPPSIANEET